MDASASICVSLPRLIFVYYKKVHLDFFTLNGNFLQSHGSLSFRVYKNNKALIKPYATKKRSGG
jgi:hypothetical protein